MCTPRTVEDQDQRAIAAWRLSACSGGMRSVAHLLARRLAYLFCSAAIFAFGLAGTATGADLVVFSAAALRSALEQLPAAGAGHIRFVFGTAGAIHDKVTSGEAFDIVILPPVPLADLVRRGLVRAETRTTVATVRLGAAVRMGAKRPAFASPDDFKRALLDAPSIGLADPASGATTGIYFGKLLKQMGIDAAIRGKLRLYPDGAAAMAALAKGEVALAAGQISEIKPVKGVDLVGPLADALQLKTSYLAAVSRKSADAQAAEDFVKCLTSMEMAPLFEAQGFDAR